jgi:hypothetical protein
MPKNVSQIPEGQHDQEFEGQPYRVSYFAKKHGLLAAEARDILDAAGGSRSRADALAEIVKGAQRRRR